MAEALWLHILAIVDYVCIGVGCKILRLLLWVELSSKTT
jgi:hypothetical protein